MKGTEDLSSVFKQKGCIKNIGILQSRKMIPYKESNKCLQNYKWCTENK